MCCMYTRWGFLVAFGPEGGGGRCAAHDVSDASDEALVSKGSPKKNADVLP